MKQRIIPASPCNAEMQTCYIRVAAI